MSRTDVELFSLQLDRGRTLVTAKELQHRSNSFRHAQRLNIALALP